jgi:antitoxin component of RelBE/YafQ-DinJ toxin-antitoxin module
MNYMEKFPIRVEVRLDNELRDQLQEKVLKLGISTSAFIRMIISETLNPNT